MKINSTEFKAVLDKLRPGLSKKEMVSGMRDFYFSGTDIVCFNGAIAIHHPLKTDFRCALDASKFAKIIQGADANEELTLDLDIDILNIKSESLEAQIPATVEFFFADVVQSITKEIQEMEWFEISPTLMEGLSLCSFSASKKSKEGSLFCVCVDGKDIFSSDGPRGSVFRMDEIVSTNTLLIRSDLIGDIARFKYKAISDSDSWIHLMTEDDIVLSIRKILGTYPIEKLRKIFDSISIAPEFDLPSELINVIESASVFTENREDSDPYIEITLKEKTLSVKSDKSWFKDTPGTGKITKKIKVEKAFPKEATFKISPVFLKEILTRSTSMKLSEKYAIFFHGEKFINLTALVVEDLPVKKEGDA